MQCPNRLSVDAPVFMNFFKPDDLVKIFDAIEASTIVMPHESWDELCKKLDKYIEERSTVVYTHRETSTSESYWSEVGRYINPTHTARIFGITEIEKKPCKHEAILNIPGVTCSGLGFYSLKDLAAANNYKCKHCGVKMKPMFQAVDE